MEPALETVTVHRIRRKDGVEKHVVQESLEGGNCPLLVAEKGGKCSGGGIGDGEDLTVDELDLCTIEFPSRQCHSPEDHSDIELLGFEIRQEAFLLLIHLVCGYRILFPRRALRNGNGSILGQ